MGLGAVRRGRALAWTCVRHLLPTDKAPAILAESDPQAHTCVFLPHPASRCVLGLVGWVSVLPHLMGPPCAGALLVFVTGPVQGNKPSD